MLMLRGAAWLGAATWFGLVVARGTFWDARAGGLRAPQPGRRLPDVYAIVPARNEADVIVRTIRALHAQRYPGRLSVLVVDDRSEDGTGVVAAASGADVLTGAPRADGWTGKVWALEQGVRAIRARGSAPVYWWFTDADVQHGPSVLAELVTTAEDEDRDVVSLMVQLHCETPAERLLIPAFVFFFMKLYPFRWVADQRRRTAAAAGGCLLMRSEALERIGGVARIKDALIDDVAFASAVKSDGGSLRLELTDESESIRPYETFGEIWSMVARSAYTQLRYSPALLAGTVLGMSMLYLVPPAATIAGIAARRPSVAAPGAFAWTLLTCAYAPMLRRYRTSLWLAPLLPLAALLYTGMTVDSARRHVGGKGGNWKGRTFTPAAR
jgi:hopene-associated glycosyltransferase HpnB